MALKTKVAIVGGGTAGITVAARLRNAGVDDITILEPSEWHYYQPMWTLVGGGEADVTKTRRPMSSVIPSGVNWIREAVAELAPEQNQLTTDAGNVVEYDWLVMAPGIQLDWDKIPGLRESVGGPKVVSNYSYETAPKTWEAINAFRGGNAVFTHPATPIKCGGAPQKIMYLADDAFRRNGVRDKSTITFANAGAATFSVPHYAAALDKVIDRKGIERLYQHDLVSLDVDAGKATFRNVTNGEEKVLDFDLIHVTPPMSAPDFVKESALAGEGGWIDVDKHTTQHVRFSNVFALGDASNLPTSKTGAAVRKQAPALVASLLAEMNHTGKKGAYDGYTSCPLVTGYGSLIMAEFDYDGNLKETFPMDQSKERRSMYLVKKYGLPAMYWNVMLKGRA